MKMVCFRLKDGKTVSKWCKENNVSYAVVWRRLDEGLMPEEACELALKTRGSHKPKYFYKGELVCRLLGSSHSKEYMDFIRKIKKGFSIEEALKGIIK